jgi:hypothetical protein
MFTRLAIFVAICGVSPLLSGPIAADDKEPSKDDPILHRIFVNRKVGFIDSSGRIVIEPQFDWACEFSEGLCQARRDSKEGYIDSSGNWAFEIAVHDDRPFRCGVAVCVGKRWGIADRSGRVINCPFDWMEDFSEGLSAVHVYEKSQFAEGDPRRLDEWRQKKCGYVDTSGKLVIPLQYTAAGSFSEGLAPVYVGGVDRMCTGLDSGHWGYINTKGEMVIKPQFSLAKPFSEGLACVSFDGNNYGWIDKTGKFAIKMRRLRIAMSFHDGVARIRGDSDSVPGWNDFGYIDRAGGVFIHPVFDAGSSPFSQGLASAREEPTWDAAKLEWNQGKYGYVDKRGNWVVEPQYTHAGPYRGGVALVQTETQVAYIDRAGKKIWSADLQPPAK